MAKLWAAPCDAGEGKEGGNLGEQVCDYRQDFDGCAASKACMFGAGLKRGHCSGDCGIGVMGLAHHSP